MNPQLHAKWEDLKKHTGIALAIIWFIGGMLVLGFLGKLHQGLVELKNIVTETFE